MSGTANREGRGIAGRTEPLKLFSPEELPTEIELDGRLLYLNTDWRDIRQIISILNNKSLSDSVKSRASLEIFVDNCEDIADGQKALEALFNFIDCGDPPRNTKGMPREMDWQVDFTAIISDMNKAAGKELRAEQYMHWFTFVAWYNAIGEGNLSYRVNLRRKMRKGEKLSPDEREWVNRNPDKLLREPIDENEDD